MPDVSITAPLPEERTEGGTAMAEPAGGADPVTMRAFVQEEHRETFVEIYEASAGQRW